jgi:uncharacterized membrane protein
MQTQSDTVPSPVILTPGVFSSYGHGWRQMWKYFLEFLLIGIIAFVLTQVITITVEAIFFPSLFSNPWQFEEMSPRFFRLIMIFELFAIIFGILFAQPLQYGVFYAYLKAARGEILEVKDMFTGFKNYWNTVLAILLVTVITLAGIAVLIIPGIIFALKLSLVPYLVTDRNLGVTDAVKESWRMTKGYTWKIFLLFLMAIPVMILGLLVLILGIIPAYMWIYTAMASFYHAVSTQNKTPEQVTA